MGYKGGKCYCDRIVSAEQAEKLDLSSYPVIGLGSGIYFTSHHPKLMEQAKRLGKGQQAFIFSTRGCPVVGKYHTALKQVLTEKQVTLMGEFSCRGYDCTGPYNLVNGGNKGKPNESDELRARKFIRRILPKEVKVPDIPLEKGKHVYVDAKSCIGCGTCVCSCPMNVLTIKDGKAVVIKDEDCTHCSKCADGCMQGSILIHHSKKEMIQIASKHAKRTSL